MRDKMPLSREGSAILSNFIKEYGAKGKNYFYAKENKDSKFANLIKRSKKKKKRK